MKGESWREKGEKREEVERIKWRKRGLAVGEWMVRERVRANRSISKSKKEGENGKRKGRGGVGCRGTVTVLSPVTHTDVRGGEEEQEEGEGQRSNL